MTPFEHLKAKLEHGKAIESDAIRVDIEELANVLGELERHYKECDTCILTGWKEKAEEIKRQARKEAIDEFATKMLFFCYGLKALQGNLCRVDVVEDKINSIERNLKEQKE